VIGGRLGGEELDRALEPPGAVTVADADGQHRWQSRQHHLARPAITAEVSADESGHISQGPGPRHLQLARESPSHRRRGVVPASRPTLPHTMGVSLRKRHDIAGRQRDVRFALDASRGAALEHELEQYEVRVRVLKRPGHRVDERRRHAPRRSKLRAEEGRPREDARLCDTAGMLGRPASLGAMGVHYVRPDLLGITAPPSPRVDGVGTHTDFREPGILISEPQDDGSLELVAVENLVFARSWRATGQSAPPTFHGVPYDTMTDDPSTEADEAHMFEPHFDRHVWIYRDNPNGVFAPFNPAVTCAHHRGAGRIHQESEDAEAHAEDEHVSLPGM